MLADWVDAKRKEKHAEDNDILVMGDFNIPEQDDELFKAVTSKGLRVPAALLGEKFGTNLAKDKRYDQILHYAVYPANFTNAGGIVDFYSSDHEPLFPGVSKNDFTYEMSDHLPLWIQINTDIDGFKLDQIIKG